MLYNVVLVSAARQRESAVHAQPLQLCLTFCDPMDCSPPGSSVHEFSSKNTGVGCHALLQGIFPTQGSYPVSIISLALAGWFSTTSATWEAQEKVEYRSNPGHLATGKNLLDYII